MPNSQTHDIITVLTAGGANAAYFYFAPHPQPNLAILFTAAYLFAGYACAGDLDLVSTEFRRWGPLRFIWLPYQKMVPHRSWISHGLVLGGVVRICYLLAMCSLLMWGGLMVYSYFYSPSLNPAAVTAEKWSSLIYLMKARPLETSALIGGFILAGTTHSLSDFTWSWFKRRF
ncbi:MAG: metal-binding protein [Armatimonadetes bacterium]|nr:metal-binding protein [Armatimonadota bacterium]